MEDREAERGIRAGVERRLAFIEHKLYWDGAVNRSDIQEAFDVSKPQASNDLSLYRQVAPENIEYDLSQRRYTRAPGFQPKYLRLNASHYLVELKSFADGVRDAQESWIGDPPSVAVMPVPGRRIDPATLQILVHAIRSKRSLQVCYHAMRGESPIPLRQRVTPHSLSSDGLRWHVRAYSHLDECFRDFLLSRFSEIGGEDAPGPLKDADVDWNCMFDVELESNPSLPKEKRATIESEYEMTNGRLVMPVRCALLYYFEKRLRLDMARSVDRPFEAPLVVSNESAMKKAMRAARGEVKGKNKTPP